MTNPKYTHAEYLRDCQILAEIPPHHEAAVPELGCARSTQDIRNLIAMYEREQWISVDDDLPDCDTPVLVYFGDPDVDVEIDYMDIEVDFGTQYWANHGDAVTHWKSIQPPQERDDE